jgi:hypothetical protein
MKKMMFLMLTLLIWGVASMNAQVTIGADRVPATDAVLDLDGAQGALLLPRVDTLDIKSPTMGMQVYKPVDNKVYTYNGTSWKTSAIDDNTGVAAGTYGETGESRQLRAGESLIVTKFIVDEKGKVTSAENVSVKMPRVVRWDVLADRDAAPGVTGYPDGIPEGCSYNNIWFYEKQISGGKPSMQWVDTMGPTYTNTTSSSIKKGTVIAIGFCLQI